MNFGFSIAIHIEFAIRS